MFMRKRDKEREREREREKENDKEILEMENIWEINDTKS